MKTCKELKCVCFECQTKEHPEDDTSIPVGFVAKDLVDAKRMAIAFAQSVS